MIRGSGVVTEIVCLGSVAGFGAGTGPVGELWPLCWVRPLSCSSSQRPRYRLRRVAAHTFGVVWGSGWVGQSSGLVPAGPVVRRPPPEASDGHGTVPGRWGVNVVGLFSGVSCRIVMLACRVGVGRRRRLRSGSILSQTTAWI